VDEPLSSKAHKLDQPGLWHVWGDPGASAAVFLVGTDRGWWIPRRRPCGWRDALVAGTCSPSAGAATGATSTAAPAARPKPARRACGVRAVATARVPKVDSITATESATAASVDASRRFAWGITLPRSSPRLSVSSRPGLRHAEQCPRTGHHAIRHPRRLDFMRFVRPAPSIRPPTRSAVCAAIPRRSTSPVRASNRGPVRLPHEAYPS